MYVEIDRVKAGVLAFLDRCVLPKLDSPMQFIAGAAVSLLGSRAEAVVRALGDNPTIKTLGLIDDGKVEIDMLHAAALEQIRKQGRVTIDFPIIGAFAFDEKDLNLLIDTIKR